MADAVNTARARDSAVTWTDAKGRQHEVPAYVAHLLKASYRGQNFVGAAAKKIMAFFEEEPVFLLKNTLTQDPADQSQVKTRLTLKADRTGKKPEYAVGAINATRLTKLILENKKVDDVAKAGLCAHTRCAFSVKWLAAYEEKLNDEVKELPAV